MYLYSNGVVSVLEGKLLKKETYNKIIDAKSYNDAKRIFKELDSFVIENETIEEDKSIFDLIFKYRQNLFEFIKRESPSNQIKDFFLTPLDYDNVSCVVKNNFVNNDLYKTIEISGNIKADKIVNAVKLKNFDLILDKALKNDLKEFFEISLDNKLKNFQIDNFFKKRKFIRLKSMFDRGFLRDLINFKIDIENLSCVIRSNSLTQLKVQLLPSGNIQHEVLFSLFKKDKSVLLSLKDEDLKRIAEITLLESKQENLKKFEKLKNEFFLKKLKILSKNTQTPAPFVYYVFRKFFEIDNLQMIFSLKRNDFDEKIISSLLIEI